jgi:hypothetical protein
VLAFIVSRHLDTNGQNARYTAAARRWGTDPDVLKALAIGKYDPASVIGRYQAAADKGDELVIRSAHRQVHIYQQMPADIVWTRQNDREVRALAMEADLIHLNNSWAPVQALNLPRRKPYLLHHHGSALRSNPDLYLQKARQWHMTQCVSTVDLMRWGRERFDPKQGWIPREKDRATLHWAPTAYDVDWLSQFGKQHRDHHDGIRVITAPTNRDTKATALVEAAVAQLQRDGLDVELVIVENMAWADCMAIKATADIYFDQVGLGYGCNAVEAWGMGIPVIAGADSWTLAKMRELWGEQLPFYEATEDTIGAAIADLAQSKAKRATWAARGFRHIRKYHDEKPALTILAGLYRLALQEQEAYIDAPAPVVKFTAGTRQLMIANRRLNFPYETDNIYMVERIRQYAQRFPNHGIQEVA